MASDSAGLRLPPPVLFPVGLAIAVLGAICGIGGGLFAVPLLHFAFGLPLRVAVGTSLWLVLATAGAATATEALRADSALVWPLLAVLAPAALVGAQIGFAVSRRIRPRALRLVFTVVLLAAGLRILVAENGAAAGGPAAFELDAAAALLAAAIGFAGGFLAPLLGVGGGLLMVPALFLGLPDVGYLGARAQSLAVAVLSSARSVYLYGREGAVHARSAAFLAAGALLGAAAGVTLVHRPGWGTYARWTMGVILVLVAVRFFREWRRDARG